MMINLFKVPFNLLFFPNVTVQIKIINDFDVMSVNLQGTVLIIQKAFILIIFILGVDF